MEKKLSSLHYLQI